MKKGKRKCIKSYIAILLSAVTVLSVTVTSYADIKTTDDLVKNMSKVQEIAARGAFLDSDGLANVVENGAPIHATAGEIVTISSKNMDDSIFNQKTTEIHQQGEFESQNVIATDGTTSSSSGLWMNEILNSEGIDTTNATSLKFLDGNRMTVMYADGTSKEFNRTEASDYAMQKNNLLSNWLDNSDNITSKVQQDTFGNTTIKEYTATMSDAEYNALQGIVDRINQNTESGNAPGYSEYGTDGTTDKTKDWFVSRATGIDPSVPATGDTLTPPTDTTRHGGETVTLHMPMNYSEKVYKAREHSTSIQELSEQYGEDNIKVLYAGSEVQYIDDNLINEWSKEPGWFEKTFAHKKDLSSLSDELASVKGKCLIKVNTSDDWGYDLDRINQGLNGVATMNGQPGASSPFVFFGEMYVVVDPESIDLNNPMVQVVVNDTTVYGLRYGSEGKKEFATATEAKNHREQLSKWFGHMIDDSVGGKREYSLNDYLNGDHTEPRMIVKDNKQESTFMGTTGYEYSAYSASETRVIEFDDALWREKIFGEYESKVADISFSFSVPDFEGGPITPPDPGLGNGQVKIDIPDELNPEYFYFTSVQDYDDMTNYLNDLFRESQNKYGINGEDGLSQITRDVNVLRDKLQRGEDVSLQDIGKIYGFDMLEHIAEGIRNGENNKEGHEIAQGSSLSDALTGLEEYIHSGRAVKNYQSNALNREHEVRVVVTETVTDYHSVQEIGERNSNVMYWKITNLQDPNDVIYLVTDNNEGAIAVQMQYAGAYRVDSVPQIEVINMVDKATKTQHVDIYDQETGELIGSYDRIITEEYNEPMRLVGYKNAAAKNVLLIYHDLSNLVPDDYMSGVQRVS